MSLQRCFLFVSASVVRNVVSDESAKVLSGLVSQCLGKKKSKLIGTYFILYGRYMFFKT